jgi:hypothetical protein
LSGISRSNMNLLQFMMLGGKFMPTKKWPFFAKTILVGGDIAKTGNERQVEMGLGRGEKTWSWKSRDPAEGLSVCERKRKKRKLTG